MSSLFYLPKAIPLSGGEVLPGARLYFFQTGTSVPQNTYTDSALSTPHSNPVQADSEGIFPPIYLDPSLPDYRVRLATSADVFVYQVDNYPSNVGGGGDELRLVGTAPFLLFDETDASANNRKWRVQASAEQFKILVLNDAESVETDVITIDRAAASPDQITIGDINWEISLGGILSTAGGAFNITGSVLASGNVTAGGFICATIETALFAPTYTGFSSNPSGSFRAKRSGFSVAIHPVGSGAVTGTSNATTFTWASGTVPAAYRHATENIHAFVLMVDNGTTITGSALIAPSGAVTFGATGVGGASSWTNSGTKGFADGWQLIYTL